MSDAPVNLSSGLPQTVLPEPPPDLADALEAAGSDRAGLGAVAAAEPRFLDAWAALGEQAEDPIERYAYFRVGYHRGLDTLRASGWRGSGYVRWAAPTNRGFLRCVEGLRSAAAAIGETQEAERCALFLQQLDPEHFRP